MAIIFIFSGYYKPSGIVGAISCPKVQIVTIEELLSGKKVQYPMHDDVTFRKASKVEEEEEENKKTFRNSQCNSAKQR